MVDLENSSIILYQKNYNSSNFNRHFLKTKSLLRSFLVCNIIPVITQVTNLRCFWKLKWSEKIWHVWDALVEFNLAKGCLKSSVLQEMEKSKERERERERWTGWRKTVQVDSKRSYRMWPLDMEMILQTEVCECRLYDMSWRKKIETVNTNKMNRIW